ncbi:MAG: hypothetical protein JXA89_26475 [Anaerolineae bacterium]|nr:hypothetical protein [Anaerolineae bacterium]
MQTNDIPIWPNATIQFSSSDLFRYTVASGPAIGQIIDFYQDEMLKQGWVAEYEPLQRANQAVLGFQKAGRSVTIIVEQVQPDRARVMVRVSTFSAVSSTQGMIYNMGSSL